GAGPRRRRHPAPAVARAPASRPRPAPSPPGPVDLWSRRGAGHDLHQHAPRLAAPLGQHLVPLLRRPRHGVPARGVRHRAGLGGAAADVPPGGGRRPPWARADDELRPPPVLLYGAAGDGRPRPAPPPDHARAVRTRPLRPRRDGRHRLGARLVRPRPRRVLGDPDRRPGLLRDGRHPDAGGGGRGGGRRQRRDRRRPPPADGARGARVRLLGFRLRESRAPRLVPAAPPGAARRARARAEPRSHGPRVGRARRLVRRAAPALAPRDGALDGGRLARRGDRRRRARLLVREPRARLARALRAVPLLAFERGGLIYSVVVTLISRSDRTRPLLDPSPLCRFRPTAPPRGHARWTRPRSSSGLSRLSRVPPRTRCRPIGAIWRASVDS